MLPRLLNASDYQAAGALDRVITLLTPNPARTSGGEFLPPLVFANCWASIKALTGRDLERAQQVVAEVSHKVIIRYIPGVVAKMLVQVEQRTFVIEAVVDQDENKFELWLLCHERNDGVIP
jgi:SPP1 family predicted phage head-tail adaptor